MIVDLSQVTWRKSSYSNGSGGNCTEVAQVGADVAIRDSKDPDGPALVVDRRAWQTFVDGLKSGTL